MSSPEEITAAAISTATLEQTRTTVIIPDIGSTVYQFPLDQHLTSSVFSLPNGIVTTVITVTGINLPIPAPTPAPVSGSPITSNGVDSRSSVAATVSRSSGQEEPSTSTSPTVKKEVLSTQRIITSGPIPSGKDTDNDGFIDSYQAKYENGTLIYGQLENSTLLGGDRNNNGRFDYTDPDDDGDGIPNFAEEKGGLSTGAKAGIAVGVVVPLLILAALAGFFFFRRKSKSKWTGGGIERGVSQRVPNAPPLPAYGPLGAAGEESLAGGAGGLVMRDPPKDDGAMSRLFRHINNRLQNHVLNYYVSPDKSIYQGQLGSCTSKVKKSLESHVSRLDHLLMQESSRVYALRAVLAGLILRKITEGSLFTDSRGGPLTVAKSDSKYSLDWWLRVVLTGFRPGPLLRSSRTDSP